MAEARTCKNISSLEDVGKLEYLSAIIKEGLRLVPPLPSIFPREALEDHDLLDIRIKKGTLVSVSLTNNTLKPGDMLCPDEFIPERWLSPEKMRMNPYSMIPFSAGPRNCLGQYLAIIETKLIILQFISTFEFHLAGKPHLDLSQRFLYETKIPLKLLVNKY